MLPSRLGSSLTWGPVLLGAAAPGQGPTHNWLLAVGLGQEATDQP